VERGSARNNVRPEARCGRCDRPSSRANYSSFFELVKRFQNSRLDCPQNDPASACENASVALMASERKDTSSRLFCDVIQFVEAVRDKVCSPGAQRRLERGRRNVHWAVATISFFYWTYQITRFNPTTLVSI